MQDYYIIYPRGNNSEIDLIQCDSWEKDDYALASEEYFSKGKDASEYAIKLAKEHNLKYVGCTFNEYGEEIQHRFLKLDDTDLNSCKSEIEDILKKYNCTIIAQDEYTHILIRDDLTDETIKI